MLFHEERESSAIIIKGLTNLSAGHTALDELGTTQITEAYMVLGSQENVLGLDIAAIGEIR